MYVQIRNSSGITLVPIDTRLLADRKVFVEGEITSELACSFVRQILELNSENAEAPIDVLINSPGGEINSGMLMYDVIQSSPAPVRMTCMGKAYSMAAVLFASGGHGRYMFPHGELMLHEPLIQNIHGGSSSSIKSISDILMETRDRMNEILVKHTGKTRKEVEEATAYDHYFSPQESIEFGLCDEIIGLDRVLI